MSIASVASSPISGSNVTLSANTSKQSQLREQFQQLGQDLQSGNLSAAQGDFASLQEASPAGGFTTTPANDRVAKALNQLQTDLQTGDLAGAAPKPVGGAPPSRCSSHIHRACMGTLRIRRTPKIPLRRDRAQAWSSWGKHSSPTTCRRHNRPITRCCRTCPCR
jgi:hypothetical protein